MTSAWLERLRAKLVQHYGTEKGNALSKKYAHAFSSSYQEDFSAKNTLDDIQRLELLSPHHPLEINLYHETHATGCRLYLKLLQYGRPIALSDILPILENMDLRTFSERPYKVTLEKDKDAIWISDFSVAYLRSPDLDIPKIQTIFQEALIKINAGCFENDGFNKLILGAEIPWRDIIILRGAAKYLQQIGFRFTQPYIENTLANYPAISKSLILLFQAKFDPQKKSSPKKIETMAATIQSTLDAVKSLDEDLILRTLLALIQAILRTNYFKKENGEYKNYFSFKLASEKIPNLPLPHPLYEVFVYSPQFEAIHLRSAKVARGGIRWSDRREDFRTEVLGLMKAQKVKNAIIVPSGAKGGFVLKAIPPHATREMLLIEVVNCYKDFMRGLLDITDNLINNKVIKPTEVVCYDDDDTYLVVAADKGTSTFSDIANAIASEYHFWLGDAFASGGSTGYDHKKMGITAKGAWESIKRHFHELDVNIDETDFTVAGIGDMSGDVFGNGLLYTDRIKLVAAFDHRDIFLDPNPNPKKSFLERTRLFKLSTSSWEDFNPKIISKGGGVFSRASKSIPISSEVKKILGIQDNFLAPNDLVRAILKAPVDLLYNGGIGTYVKATSESHADVGDKTNEFCRINGDELRCRVVAEGGNLGFTQLGRIEYALQGGLINTDFIDNSGGVDCSDHEVNLKILLNKEVLQGTLTEKKRNQLLASMTHEVSALVLQDNYNQALAMAIAVDHSAKLIGLYQNYLKELEDTHVLDRAVEFLPDNKKIVERKTAGQGLMSPELAVLLAYSKIHIKSEILKTDVTEDPYFSEILEKAFPAKICQLYGKSLQAHPLRREIIATYLSNQVVNEMGITFVYRMHIETGALVSDIIRAQFIAASIFKTQELQKLIDSPIGEISASMQHEILHHIRHLANLAARWFLRVNRLQGSMKDIIAHYSAGVKKLETIIPDLMLGATKMYLEKQEEHFTENEILKNLVRRAAILRAMYTSLNIIEVATQQKFDLIKTTKVYFTIGGRFSLVWFRDQIGADSREGHWNTLARLTLRDELDILQKLLTIEIMKSDPKGSNIHKIIDHWVTKNELAINRWEKLLGLLSESSAIDYSMFFIAIRELSNWVSMVALKK